MPISISHTTKTQLNGDFSAIAEKILGKRYNVSLVFVGESKAQKLNESTRGKTYVPNVLSFSLSPTEGEIYICPKVAAKEASKFSLSVSGYIHFLCIHGCLHLKGLDHGSEMTKLEEKYSKLFSLH